MKFTEILEELKKGEKVTREEWGEPDCTIDFIMYDQKKDKCEFYRDGKYYDEFVWVYEDIIAEDWKIYEEPTQVWKPKEGEAYYVILTHGFIDYTIYDSDNRADNERLSLGNCFKTREEAEHMLEKIKIINKLKELSNFNFGNDINEIKYSIGYYVDTKKVCPNMNRFTRIMPFEVYFASKEDCQKAIEIIGEENLKKYYFDIVEEEK
jgi:hypothetical protein